MASLLQKVGMMRPTEAIPEIKSSQTSLTDVMIAPRDLKPSPENNKVYKPVDPKDPAIRD